jgi:hypothetical protein
MLYARSGPGVVAPESPTRNEVPKMASKLKSVTIELVVGRNIE